MDIQKFTKKSVEAIQSAQRLAMEYGNQQIEQAHILHALLSQADGLVPELINGDFRER